jgi:hypothetical protein
MIRMQYHTFRLKGLPMSEDSHVLALRYRPVIRREPTVTGLLLTHGEGFAAVDAWAAPIYPGETTDPIEWARAVFALPPLVGALMRIRDVLVRPFGLTPGMPALGTTGKEMPAHTGFPLIAQTANEAVLGLDDKHLDFRVSINTADGHVVLTTAIKINNRVGRLYWAIVRLFHPWIVRSALSRAKPLRS